MAIALALIAAGCAPSLHDVAAKGDIERAAALIARGPGFVHAVNGLGKTPLHYAVHYKQIPMMALLVERGADIAARDKTGLTPLHVAALLGRRDEAQWLIEHGADVHALDAFGDTPLHTAAAYGQGGTIAALAAAGARLDRPNAAGLTPLDLARKHRFDRVAAFLEKLQSQPPDSAA